MGMMKPEKAEKLKSAGFEVGDTASFLKLTPDEAEQVDARKIASGGAKNKCGESG